MIDNIPELVPEPRYSRRLLDLAAQIHKPQFPEALGKFLYFINHPDAEEIPRDAPLRHFEGIIHVHHSATATFYAPSDLCGAGGMQHEIIRSTPDFRGGPRYDTVFVEVDADQTGFLGMMVARVFLFFSFHYRRKEYSCALAQWYIHEGDVPDPDTGMWQVKPERGCRGEPIVDVIDVDSIV